MSVLVGHGPAAPLGRVADVDAYAASKLVSVDEHARDAPWQRQEEDTEADFDFQHIAQRADGPVPDSKSVACLGAGTAEQVKVVVCLIFQSAYRLGQVVGFCCGGQCRPEPRADRDWWWGRSLQLAHRLAVDLGELDQFLRRGCT